MVPGAGEEPVLVIVITIEQIKAAWLSQRQPCTWCFEIFLLLDMSHDDADAWCRRGAVACDRDHDRADQGGLAEPAAAAVQLQQRGAGAAAQL